MNRAAGTQPFAVANRDAKRPGEPVLAQIGGFVDFIILLLVLRSFFLPLFIIPTGSMAETLCGEYSPYTCPNCAHEFQVGFHTPQGPPGVQCPNCRWFRDTAPSNPARAELRSRAGDRIAVHGWTFDIGGMFAPQRWDVVVFKNPNSTDENYIKRLVGLPGETLEIVDGDLFVQAKGASAARVARKTRTAQDALWFPYYNHDELPARPAEAYKVLRNTRDGAIPLPPARAAPYHPRWMASAAGQAWKGLDRRVFHFDGLDAARQEIRFVTGAPDQPPLIDDHYGYNGPAALEGASRVTDVRVSTDVSIGGGSGAIELSVSKDDSRFTAGFSADGRITLERSARGDAQRELWAQTRLPRPLRAARIAIAHVDYQVLIEVDREIVLVSPLEKYDVSIDQARERAAQRAPAEIGIAASDLRASFAHVRIDRDIHYTQAFTPSRKPGHATQGHPITLRDDAYFVCGDNSPNSLDARCWEEDMLAGYLRERLQRGEYELGTVPADQMLGRAFLVYCPGFMPLLPKLTNVVPDLGRLRWIH